MQSRGAITCSFSSDNTKIYAAINNYSNAPYKSMYIDLDCRDGRI
jgi:hypothetical protein